MKSVSTLIMAVSVFIISYCASTLLLTSCRTKGDIAAEVAKKCSDKFIVLDMQYEIALRLDCSPDSEDATAEACDNTMEKYRKLYDQTAEDCAK